MIVAKEIQRVMYIPSGSGLLFRAVRWHVFFGMGRLWFLWCHHPEPEAILSGLSCHAAWGVVSCVFFFCFFKLNKSHLADGLFGVVGTL